MRLSLAALLAGSVLAVAGCGGGDSAATGGQGAASIAPKTAALYASINTDIDSDQVNQLEELLAKFPDRQRLFDEIQSGLADEDVSWETDIKPALGQTLDIVLLDFEDGSVVGVLKPADKDKLKALLAKGENPSVSREIEGWTVVAEDEATLDRFETARSQGALEGDAGFEDAMDGLPEEALLKLYVNGEAATRAAEGASGAPSSTNRVKAFAAALGAESNGIQFDGALKAELQGELSSIEPYDPKLLEAAPEGAFAILSANGYGQVQKSLKDVPGTFNQLRGFLGVDLGDLTRLLEGEFALWVAPGAPIPEVTFLAETDDEQAALAALEKLVGVIAASGDAERRTTEIDGVQARQVLVDGFPITYAVFDGRVIVTTRPGAIADVRGGGDSLADDPTFKQAQEDAGMGDTTFGFVYLDVEKLAALVEGFAGVSGAAVPPEVARNLEPLGALLFHASGEAEDMKLSAFLAIE